MEADYYRIAQSLFSRTNYEWRRYVRHVLPKLIPAADLAEMEDDGMPERVCARAKTGVLKLASAHLNYITPRGQNWFKYDEWEEITDDEQFWLKGAAQITQKELEASNFYTSFIATVIDRIGTGTGLMMSEENIKKGSLVFTHVPAGTYGLAENEDHEIDTVVRKFKYTAHQAAAAFGEDALSGAIKDAFGDQTRRYTQQFEIWHLVLPRDVPPMGNRNLPPEQMSWASVYLDPAEQHIIKESGYYEFPYMGTRFIKYGNDVCGESALAPIVDTIEDSLLMQEAMKVAGQAAAFPRVLLTSDMVDEVDMRAGGMTVLRPEDIKSGLPREWATATEYTVGKDLLEMYNAEIDDALFVSVLQAVSQVERQMTALEANLRDNERMMTFTQSFTQFTSDIRPMMERVFCSLERLGKFPEDGKPQGLFVPLDEYGIKMKILAPGVKCISKMAKALERYKLSGLVETLGHAVNLAQTTGNPAWMDPFDENKSIRYIADETNVPVECMRKPRELEALQKKREEEAGAMQQAKIAQMMAAANRDNAGAASQESNLSA